MNKKLVPIALLIISVLVFAHRKNAAAAPAADNAVIDAVKQIYVCPSGAAQGLTIEESETMGALCPEGAKVIEWAERLQACGWSKDDIVELLGLLRMGESIVQKNGAPACAEPGRLKLDLFIMSYCPYGVQFIPNMLEPMSADLGDSLNFTPYFLLGKDQNGNLASGHGPKELEEDLRMICLRDKWNVDTWMKYASCFAKEIYGNKQNPKDWKFCAEAAGVDAEKLGACTTTEAPGLAEKDLALSEKYGIQYSPTAVYNCNGNVVGASPYMQMKPILCNMFTGEKPPACAK